MRGHKNYCILGLQATIFMMCLFITPPTLSEATNANAKPPTVLLGTVYCNTEPSHLISGARVSIKCNDGAFKAVVKTNKQGMFKLHLTSSIEGCHVSLVKGSDPSCATSSIRHVIKQQSGGHVSNEVESEKPLLSPITSGPFFGLGPIMQPVIPQFPPFFGLPNPFQPSPPSFGLPGGVPGSPNPFQSPSPPSFGFPGSPNPFQSPSPPSFGFPGGVPGGSARLTPSPPALPVPFPPGTPEAARKGSP